MASLKSIRKRIGSVKNTRKITRAMKLVAAAKLRRAQDAIIAARPYAHALIVALAVGDPALAHVDDYGADALLLDSPVPGSGNVFDWALAEGVPVGRRMILAGGLTPDNVAAAVAEVQPWGVDTSTGVQADGDPTRKDPLKVQRFVRSARAAAPRPYHPEGNGPFDWADAGL